jgi:maleylpyruvate isomerase
MARRISQVRSSTARFLEALRELRLTDEAVRRPSLLPGWSRAHVLTHVARNADALCRAAEGALRGSPTEMYPDGAAHRDSDIEAGAGRDAEALVADVADSAERLHAVWSTMTDAAWDETTVTRTGSVPTWRTVAMRWREVEIHWVDLDLGYGPGDWPATFIAPLLPSLLERLDPRLPAGLRVEIEATDSGQRWEVGDGDQRANVRGPSWALVGWLVGRPSAVRAELGETPPLAPWA